MKKLTEIYGLSEGPFDDINKQLGSAQSVARDPRSPQRGKYTGSTAKMQADVDSATSVVKKEAGYASGDDEVPINLTVREMTMIMAWAVEKQNPELQKKFRAAINGADAAASSSSSSTVSHSVGGLKLQ